MLHMQKDRQEHATQLSHCIMDPTTSHVGLDPSECLGSFLPVELHVHLDGEKKVWLIHLTE